MEWVDGQTLEDFSVPAQSANRHRIATRARRAASKVRAPALDLPVTKACGLGPLLKAAHLAPAVWSLTGASRRRLLSPGLCSCCVVVCLRSCSNRVPLLHHQLPQLLLSLGSQGCSEHIWAVAGAAAVACGAATRRSAGVKGQCAAAAAAARRAHGCKPIYQGRQGRRKRTLALGCLDRKSVV